MSAIDSDIKREDILLAFSVEPLHDKATVERYLALYPQYTEDFIDLLGELRSPPVLRSDVVEDEDTVRRAWDAFTAVPPRNLDSASIGNPFASFTGPTFVALAEGLRIRRSILIALRDRLINASSVPAPFLNRLARAMQFPAEKLRAYLDLPAVVPAGASFKSNENPAAGTKIDFEQLLENSGISADEKRDIFISTE
ncbi:hypothetical protein [Bradyrhizobium sp. CCBAU 21360]|uniref:hypothetical protein n=1 Tax=Bradyrhizobium sp. CCBAU 21360 TaxID=1325081 RepID=UPI0023055741|nr:hypothetical protein [Bradyrhizobium sp. CCBAU 21360]MDA9451087.1 hypothetical protein [Bradyrhizobium sp. CCBAU 21360]